MINKLPRKYYGESYIVVIAHALPVKYTLHTQLPILDIHFLDLNTTRERCAKKKCLIVLENLLIVSK